MRLDDFEPIPFNEKVLDENGNEVPNFRISRLVSCYWDYHRDFKTNPPPLPISDELDDIFTTGSKEHYEDQVLMKGAKCIIDIESRKVSGDTGGMKLKHKSGTFTITGHIDYLKFDLRAGIYIEDLKSCKLNSFYYFVKCIEHGLSDDYKYQLGGYAYMLAHYIGYYIDRGVITRILKREKDSLDKRIIRMSVEDRIPNENDVKIFILKHPVILCEMGLIDENKLINLCIQQMAGENWKCTSCGYNPNVCKDTSQCPIYPKIK